MLCAGHEPFPLVGGSAARPQWEGGGCAIKAEGVCRLVLPGVCTSLPSEEGILHSWKGGGVWLPTRWVGVRRVGGCHQGTDRILKIRGILIFALGVLKK